MVISEFAARRASPISLRTMWEWAHPSRTLEMAQFLHRELPIRMSQRIVELERLPFDLDKCPDVRWIVDTYSRHVELLASLPQPTESWREEIFAANVDAVLSNRVEVPKRLAMAVRRAELENSAFSREKLDFAMERFFVPRIGLRLLVEHYLRARGGGESRGELAGDCRPGRIATQAAAVARELCRRDLGDSPEIDVVGDLEDAIFTYPPAHCRYIILELLKNSCRAVVDHHQQSAQKSLPPIRVVVACGDEDISLKISDRGGGFARPEAKKIFSWFYSRHSLPHSSRPETSDQQNDPSIALTEGYGIGLPLSRAHALYFGGNLELKALEGHGVDTYLHLSRLGTECENLPRKVMASPSYRDSTLDPPRSFPPLHT